MVEYWGQVLIAPDKPNRPKETTVTPPQAYREIPLTKGQVAIVDLEDYPELSLYKWQANWMPSTRVFYAARSVSTRNALGRYSQYRVYMHRQILGLERGDKRVVDHAFHNTLDNRRYIDGKENLRIATNAQNQWNRGVAYGKQIRYKGVYRQSKHRWQARIMVNGIKIALGTFDSPELAYAAYCAAALKYHGQFVHIDVKSLVVGRVKS